LRSYWVGSSVEFVTWVCSVDVCSGPSSVRSNTAETPESERDDMSLIVPDRGGGNWYTSSSGESSGRSLSGLKGDNVGLRLGARARGGKGMTPSSIVPISQAVCNSGGDAKGHQQLMARRSGPMGKD